MGSIDNLEFVEIGTGGVAGLTLTGYVLVFFDGADDTSYFAVDLSVPTTSAGLLVVGNSLVAPFPQITMPNQTLQNGADAVAIFQGTAADFPAGTPVAGLAPIDALVHDTGQPDDAGLIAPLLGAGAGAVQVDEASTDAEAHSMRRCGAARRDGRVFDVGTPSPGVFNGPSCP